MSLNFLSIYISVIMKKLNNKKFYLIKNKTLLKKLNQILL